MTTDQLIIALGQIHNHHQTEVILWFDLFWREWYEGDAASMLGWKIYCKVSIRLLLLLLNMNKILE